MLNSLRRMLIGNAGSSAVEFALVAPLFILLLFGMIIFSAVMTTYGSIQQLVAEGARASVGGMSDTERDQLARTFINASVTSYPYLDPAKLTIATAGSVTPVPAFTVTVGYTMSGPLADTLGGLIPFGSKHIQRSAVVQRGGW